MNRKSIFMLAVLCPAAALAQVDADRYRTVAVPPPSMYGAYGGYGYGYGGASTAAESAMDGMASVISSKGDYNLQTSEAAENLTKAQSQEIQNRQQATNTYFSMKATNKAATAAERGPRPTMEQLTRIAAEGVPKPLNASQMDPVTGGLNWPDFLQAEMFKSQRAEVDQLNAKRASQGGLSYQDSSTMNNVINSMFGELKANIKNISPPDYIACRTFLNSLAYAATKNELQ